ncbi:MAG: response regulator [Candidatus Marinimicrobia bacterium]|nr:response regulator [Candidatus Neomarinimicrobiota bacterium]
MSRTDRTILWADDEIDLLKPHILFLEEHGYHVTGVHSGEDAVHAITTGSFHLVLLDEMMDGMDGLSTLQAINELNPALPVIMITKNEEEWLMNEAIAANIAGYLTKPVNPSQIFMACKSALDKTRIRGDKAASRYLEAFQGLSSKVDEAGTLDQWIEIFHELTDWDIEFDEHHDLGLEQLLTEQHITANQRFGQLASERYLDWLKAPEGPVFSHQVLDKFVRPHLDDGRQVVFLVMDCLRLDQWKAMRVLMQDRYAIEDDIHLSLLPTATPFSRNAIFSGMLASELQRKYADEWNEMWRSETSQNSMEYRFLADYLQRSHLLDAPMKYFKILTADEGRKVLARMGEYRDTRLLAMVVNFVDLLAHHRAKSDVILEILPDEAGYRSTICSWLEKSWLLDLLRTVSEWEDTTVVITSDHGSIMVDKPVKVSGDRTTSSGVRYKYGKNLRSPEKGGLTIKKPAEYFLPSTDINTNYIIARDRNFFVFPSDYHRFVKRFEGSFQHGGISLEEMIVPVATLTPREGR